MNEEKTNYGKIIAVTIAVIAAAASIAFVLYRLCQKLISFLRDYRELDEEPLDIDFDELDEELLDEDAEEDPAEEIVVVTEG